MNLRQRQVTSERIYDFFWNLAHVVPLSDPPNRHTRPSNARSPAANVRTPRVQTTYLGHGCHNSEYNALTKPATESGLSYMCTRYRLKSMPRRLRGS
jgi:hypothetical protein